MKIAFFGTPDFVTEFLETLKEAGYTPSLVVTGLDVPVGRSLTITKPKPKLWSEQEGILCMQPTNITEAFIETLQKEQFDLFIVVAYGKILPEALINLPRFGTINVHYSLLPKYRGATPVESAILQGDTETGVCIQQMVYALDAGDILAQKKVTVHATENHIQLRERLNQEAKPLLLLVIGGFQNNTLTPVKQDESQKSICKKIKKEHGLISLNEDPEILYRKYRAYFGWPGIFFFDTKNEKQLRVKITQARLESSRFIVEKVVPEGKKEMTYTDYQNWK